MFIIYLSYQTLTIIINIYFLELQFQAYKIYTIYIKHRNSFLWTKWSPPPPLPQWEIPISVPTDNKLTKYEPRMNPGAKSKRQPVVWQIVISGRINFPLKSNEFLNCIPFPGKEQRLCYLGRLPTIPLTRSNVRVLLSDGNSKIGAHMCSDLDY